VGIDVRKVSSNSSSAPDIVQSQVRDFLIQLQQQTQRLTNSAYAVNLVSSPGEDLRRRGRQPFCERDVWLRTGGALGKASSAANLLWRRPACLFRVQIAKSNSIDGGGVDESGRSSKSTRDKAVESGVQ